MFVTQFLAAEDRNFYSNKAFSITGLIMRAVQQLTCEAVTAGGSTITQQYAKTAFLTPEPNDSTKNQRACNFN